MQNTPMANTVTSNNPYAAPQANVLREDDLQDASTGSYYAISSTKLLWMSILTFNLYDLSYWWRQWRHVRDHQGEDVSVFWRTVFSPFMFFGFTRELRAQCAEAEIPTSVFMREAPVIYLVGNIVGRILDRIDSVSPWLVLLTVLAVVAKALSLVVTQNTINSALARNSYRGPVNRGPTIGSLLFGLVGAGVWAFALLAVFIPEHLLID